MELIKMTREAPQFEGGPVEADVHPNEVAGFIAAGWQTDGDYTPPATVIAEAEKARDLSDATAAELRTMAEDLGIEFSPKTTKADLVRLIETKRQGGDA